MQYSENFGLKEPEYGEKAKVDDLNFNTEKIDTVMGNNRSMIAEYFVQTQSYTAGKVVQLNGKTYRFKVDHAPGNFNPSEVDEEPLGNFIGEGGGSAEVTKEASGNPIELTDAASAPMVRCVTQITGSQDLHGYDKPWVGGAGKNKLPLVLVDIKSQNTNGTWSGNSYTLNCATYTINTDDDGNVIGILGTYNGSGNSSVLALTFDLPAGDYILSSGFAENMGVNDTLLQKSGTTIARGNNVAPGTQFTLSENSTVTWYFRIESATKNCTPMIRLSTVTDSTFAPYSNICPITAYTEGEIEVVGHNIWDEQWEVGSINKDTGQNTTGLSDGIRSKNYIPVQPSTEYHIIQSGENSGNLVVYFYAKDKSFVIYTGQSAYQNGYNGVLGKFITPSNVEFVRFRTAGAYGQTYNDDIALNYPSNIDDYSPYKGTPHTTTYPSAIFRGSEDVVEGEVTSEWGYSKGGTRGAIDSSGKLYKIADINDSEFTQSGDVANIISSHLPVLSLEGARAANYPSICKYGVTVYVGGFVGNESALDALLPDLEIAYKLATPTTSSVTPTNLPIKSLSGYNHIESSTGDMEVEYITEEYQPLVDLIQSSNGHTYSTQEQVVGKWIDGKTIYEKTYTNATEQSVSYQTWTPTVISATDIDRIVNLFTTRDADGGTYIPVVTRKENGYVEIFAAVGWIYNNITIQYTKTSSNNRSLSKSAPIEEDLSSEDEKSENTVTEEVNEK